MSATHKICHNVKTYHVQNAGYADPCGRGFVAAGKSQRSEQGASFAFSDPALRGVGRLRKGATGPGEACHERLRLSPSMQSNDRPN